jgi:hypothetical protein
MLVFEGHQLEQALSGVWHPRDLHVTMRVQQEPFQKLSSNACFSKIGQEHMLPSPKLHDELMMCRQLAALNVHRLHLTSYLDQGASLPLCIFPNNASYRQSLFHFLHVSRR